MASTSTCDSGDTSNVAEPALATADREASSESPRLFIVCGRDRTVEQVRDLFGLCGAIRHLHLATDRSNKSRGFAFLQYQEAASAIAAIHRFDKTTLSDGHVLKVTVARETARPPAASTPAAAKDSTISTQPGKLKRNQHSQDDRNETGGDGNATDGGAFPGKRQRSSPPTSAIAVATLPKLWKRSHAPFAKLIVATRLPDDEIADVLGGIIAQIERLYGEETGEMEKKSATPTAVLGSVPAAAKRKAPTALTRPAADEGGNLPTAACESRSPRVECETVRPSKLKSQRTTAAQATPNNRPVFVRDRRRVPVDESDSSLDDASDASAGRRKRSNTEPDDAAGLGAAHARRRLSDLSELSLSPAGNSSPSTSKKRCSRRSSASSSSSTLPTFQDAPFRHVAPVFVPALPPAMAPPPIRRRRTGPRATLFFTSTVKFTLQELEAMFSVYEQFDHVQITKSFGRVKTMAYVAYASPEAARSVLSSFLDDNDGDDHGLMKLAYSDSDGPTSSFTVPPPSNSHVSTSAAGESTSSEITPPPPRVDAELAVPPTIPTENCWLMILYDRGLTNDAISSCAAACDGMEFMDIKMFRSTGESQGVAFVKFETEECAHAASQHLHNSEFPVGARKYLQAMVITDPALFSTAHGASVVAPPSTTYHPGEDGELGVVEARFAHLMSGTSEPPSGPVASMANAVSVEDEVVEREQFYPPRRPSDPAVGASAFVQQAGSLPPPHTAPPPYGFFQFGQPYPYGATGHSHHQLPHTYRQHPPPPFYPHGVYTDQPTWGYEGVYPMWPGEAGSPMLSDYSAYAWEPATPTHSVSSRAEPTSVFVSSSRPLDLSCLMKAIQDCPGVVGFTKQERDGVAFVVDFGEPRLAIEAATKLDGTMCNGNKLRVAVASGHRPPPSRRKRQRLDQRGRRK